MKKWTTGSGETLYLWQMTDAHLLNAIRALERGTGFIELNAWNALIRVSDEMAEFEIENFIHALQEAGPEYLWPSDDPEQAGYLDLLNEASEREL